MIDDFKEDAVIDSIILDKTASAMRKDTQEYSRDENYGLNDTRSNFEGLDENR